MVYGQRGKAGGGIFLYSGQDYNQYEDRSAGCRGVLEGPEYESGNAPDGLHRYLSVP